MKKKESTGGGDDSSSSSSSSSSSAKKKKRIVRRKPTASRAIQEMKQKKKKALVRGEGGGGDDDIIFVPKGKGHSRDRNSSVEVDAPNDLPPPEGPPSMQEAAVSDDNAAAAGAAGAAPAPAPAATADNGLSSVVTGVGASPNVLRVDILSCSDLREADGAGNKSDPYVKVKTGKKKGRTRTVKSHLHPVFNERFEFRIEEDALDALNLEVFDKDLMSDDRLGSIAPLDLNGIAGLREGGRVKMELPLVGKKAKPGSTVSIALEWYYSADAATAAGGKKKKGRNKGKETVKPTPIPQDQAEAEVAKAAAAAPKASTKPKAGLSESSDEWDGDDLRKNTNPFDDLVGDAGVDGATAATANAQATTAGEKTQGRALAEALFLLLDADHSDRLEKKEFREQLRAQEEAPAVQALYASAGIVNHHASGKQVKRLFDAIDAQHMTMDGDGKRFIDMAELTAFCEKQGSHSKA
jgi:hypothetical protein